METISASEHIRVEEIEKENMFKSSHYKLSDKNPDLTYKPHTDRVAEDSGTNKDDLAWAPPKPTDQTATYRLRSLEKVPNEANIVDHDIHLLHKACHADPFGVLGVHEYNGGPNGTFIVIRAWVKDAKDMKLRCVPKSMFTLDDNNEPVWLHQRVDWLFQMAFEVTHMGGKPVDQATLYKDLVYELVVRYQGDASETEYMIRDSFNFGILLPDYDLKMFQTGSCWHVDNLMGSHIMEYAGAKGVRFAVWAPSAVFVSVVGDFNQWDGRAHPMRKRHEYGVWELFVPIARAGQIYGYRIHSNKGLDFVKIDPYAQEYENPPKYASIISGHDDAYRSPEERFKWTDDVWIKRREELGRQDLIRREPMSIYEVHLPSWRRDANNGHLGYRYLADCLVEHVKRLNFTHVELLPLAQHPYEPSWGYQCTGLYAPYSRLGKPDDLKYLVNKLHENGIGVFIDFVPAHFCKDSWGLVYYDGEPCYEYADPREGEHKGWGTAVYNFRRPEVCSFILGAAYHWLRRYHIDGIRVDAVSSMVYKNYCRTAWIPNEFGGDANLQAIRLLQEMNWVVHKEWPGVYTMAEESTSWAGVTDKKKGLGFDAKWDLGWMNDTLAYLCHPGPDRWRKHSKLTFRGLYFGNEKWVLPLSHDEVVSGKGSLLDKCGFKGTPFDERIKTLRALFGFQIGLPGRPLIFMGGEFAQGREWSDKGSIDWHESAEDLRGKFMAYMTDILWYYKTCPALHAGDDETWNFQWVDCDNAKDQILAFLRKYGEWYNDTLVLINFSANNYHRYPIGVPHGGEWTVLVNSDDWKYGGSMHGLGNGSKVGTSQGGKVGWPYCLWLDIPQWSCMILQTPRPEEADMKQQEEERMAREAAARAEREKEEREAEANIHKEEERMAAEVEKIEKLSINNAPAPAAPATSALPVAPTSAIPKAFAKTKAGKQ